MLRSLTGAVAVGGLVVVTQGCGGSVNSPSGGRDGATDTSTGSRHDTGRPADSGTHADVGQHDAHGSVDSGQHADSGTGDSGGGSVMPPSCAPSGPGMTNCPTATGTESCCTSLEVPGGTYDRTYTNVGTGPTAEADPATVSGLRVDEYLVTVGRFRQFVTAWSGGYYPSAGSGKHTHLNGGRGVVNSGAGGGYEPGWDATNWNNTTDIDPTNTNLACHAPYSTWTNTATTHENLPINCVDWYEAYAFCIWDGGFLPSEAEWEYAAAGGGQELEYPWGNAAVGTACPGAGCEYAIYNCDYPSGSGDCSGVTNIAPVGHASRGVARWGQLDMAGEVFEWNLDGYATYADPCTDCAETATASYRVLRGGSFLYGATYLLPPNRTTAGTPSLRNGLTGFRCGRTL
jgi:sulfatase modifying factor 1